MSIAGCSAASTASTVVRSRSCSARTSAAPPRSAVSGPRPATHEPRGLLSGSAPGLQLLWPQPILRPIVRSIVPRIVQPILRRTLRQILRRPLRRTRNWLQHREFLALSRPLADQKPKRISPSTPRHCQFGMLVASLFRVPHMCAKMAVFAAANAVFGAGCHRRNLLRYKWLAEFAADPIQSAHALLLTQYRDWQKEPLASRGRLNNKERIGKGGVR